jgi:uncharacterized membrane protein YbhN (UPF0104 family)
MKKLLKTYLRCLILGLCLYFIATTLHKHWSDLASVSLEPQGWLFLLGAVVVTFLAHAWSGWVWFIILLIFRQPIQPLWAIQVYLWTNIAKYLPGNIWHFYGRIIAIKKVGGSLGVASLSVLLEPLLMAAAALMVAILSNWFGLINAKTNPWHLGGQIFLVSAILFGIHPFILNRVLTKLGSLKGTPSESSGERVRLTRYPWLPLLGELGFLLLRGLGFILTLRAFTPVKLEQIPHLLSVFSFSWLVGLVVPGAPGGLGVFEASMLSILDKSYFSPALVLSTVAAYRIISIVAELIGAGLAKISVGDLLRQLKN